MGEDVRRDFALEYGGGFPGLNKQAEAAGIVPAEEVKCHRCTLCGRVFSTGKALGGHVSSAHGSFKKSRPSPKKRMDSTGFETGKFTCKFCGKSFISEKAVHGHMRLHSERERRGTEPPFETDGETPMKSPLKPEIIADMSGSEHVRIALAEDFIKNLKENTVRGRRGRPGTKRHRVDSPETYLRKKKALLSCDPLELRKILDDDDDQGDSGYFRRVFGKFLEFKSGKVEEKCDVQKDLEMGDDRR